MWKLLFISVFLSLLFSCAVGPTPQQRSDNFVRSGISVCGGGLDSGVSATIEAEYEKQKGNIDAGFKEYVHTILDANGASEQKYEKYINCILTIDERERITHKSKQCKSDCNNAHVQCKKTIELEYLKCLRSGQAQCFRECKTKYKLSNSTCRQNCDTNEPVNIGNWERKLGCDGSSFSQCNQSYSNCVTACE